MTVDRTNTSPVCSYTQIFWAPSQSKTNEEGWRRTQWNVSIPPSLFAVLPVVCWAYRQPFFSNLLTKHPEAGWTGAEWRSALSFFNYFSTGTKELPLFHYNSYTRRPNMTLKVLLLCHSFAFLTWWSCEQTRNTKHFMSCHQICCHCLSFSCHDTQSCSVFLLGWFHCYVITVRLNERTVSACCCFSLLFILQRNRTCEMNLNWDIIERQNISQLIHSSRQQTTHTRNHTQQGCRVRVCVE